MTMPSQEELAQVDVDRGYSLPEHENTEGMAKFLLSNDDMINQFTATMLGMLFDEDKKEFYRIDKNQEAEPIMNSRGIAKWVGFLSLMTNKGVLHSNLKKDEVAELALQTLMDVGCDVFVNNDKYDLHVDDMDLFLAEVKLIVFTTLKRPQEAGERRALNTKFKQIEHMMRREGESGQKSDMSFFKGGKR